MAGSLAWKLKSLIQPLLQSASLSQEGWTGWLSLFSLLPIPHPLSDLVPNCLQPFSLDANVILVQGLRSLYLPLSIDQHHPGLWQHTSLTLNHSISVSSLAGGPWAPRALHVRSNGRAVLLSTENWLQVDILIWPLDTETYSNLFKLQFTNHPFTLFWPNFQINIMWEKYYYLFHSWGSWSTVRSHAQGHPANNRGNWDLNSAVTNPAVRLQKYRSPFFF